MKKRIIATVLCLVVAFGASMAFGCGGGGVEAFTPDEKFEAEYTSASYLAVGSIITRVIDSGNVNTLSGFETNGASGKFYTKQTAEGGRFTLTFHSEFNYMFMDGIKREVEGWVQQDYNGRSSTIDVWADGNTVYTQEGGKKAKQIGGADFGYEYITYNYADYACFKEFTLWATELDSAALSFETAYDAYGGVNVKINMTGYEIIERSGRSAYITGHVIYVFDDGCHLVGFYSEMSVDSPDYSDDETFDVAMELVPFTGTGVIYPDGCENWSAPSYN